MVYNPMQEIREKKKTIFRAFAETPEISVAGRRSVWYDYYV